MRLIDLPLVVAIASVEILGSLTHAADSSSSPASGPVAPGQNQSTRPDTGYRGIWFTLGQFSEHGDKYSGGLGTYTASHVSMDGEYSAPLRIP